MKKLISAALSAAICAGAISGIAVTASAATTTTTLSYYKDSTALSEYQYSESTALATSADTNNDTYTLDETGKAALAAAKAGDTLTIEYDIESNGTAQYRCGIKLYDQQFYVNCAGSTGVNNSFTTQTSNIASCHLNGKFTKDNESYQKAHVKYVFELAEGGLVSKVTPSITDGGNTTKSYSAQDISSTNKAVETVVINTLSRGTSTYDNTYAKLTNFSAVLTTTTEDPAPAITEATAYKYTVDESLANPDVAGFTADITGYSAVNSATWYLKRTTDTEYKMFTEATLPANVSPNGGEVKIGLIVTGLNAQGVTASDLSAGYTVSGTAATE